LRLQCEKALFIGFVLGLINGSLRAQNPNVDDIVEKSDLALRAKTQEGKGVMTVHTPDWERTLEMDYWSVNPDKEFIRITGPAKEAGTSTLRIGSNMWNYLPQVERVIKIPPSLMLQPWMGSDFTNDDLVKESSLVNDYTHRLDGEATEDGDACYRVIATPKPGAPVVWGRQVLTIRKSDCLPRRQQFYDDKGHLQKVLTYEEIHPVDGRNYPLHWKMVSVTKPGHETLLIYRDLKFDRPIPERIFSQQNMKRPL
ncbi:MAG TPA: outer membrane lipoprotein-sorting protein, partial [Terriglobia bacterium]|nr:outer membrane lipoprotein-sorting protein [Terriglobia bacterium]